MAEEIKLDLQTEMEIRAALEFHEVCEGDDCDNEAEWLASHPGCTTFLCDGCAQATIKQKHLVTLLTHMRPEIEGTFTCKKCNGEFLPSQSKITRI